MVPCRRACGNVMSINPVEGTTELVQSENSGCGVCQLKALKCPSFHSIRKISSLYSTPTLCPVHSAARNNFGS